MVDVGMGDEDTIDRARREKLGKAESEPRAESDLSVGRVPFEDQTKVPCPRCRPRVSQSYRFIQLPEGSFPMFAERQSHSV